ncbi:MAG: hypothetical protein MK095_06615 [Phycisphaerales bacterium]|nr:hypothetical protein [Phycisphaerales bacterium]
MNQPQSTSEQPLARHQGWATMSAPEAILKAILECVPNVQVLSLVETPAFLNLIQILREPSVRDLMRMHRLRIIISRTAPRALEQARWAAREKKHAVALLGGPTSCDALGLLLRDSDELFLDQGSALSCIVVDAPSPDDARTPGSMSIRSELPVLSASTVEHLRNSVEHGLRLSRANNTPTITLAHPSLIASGSTFQLRPNRSADDPSTLVQRRSRGPRWTESGGALRMARRLELNTHHALPSPGDPSPVGFITVGPAAHTLRQLSNDLGLAGRVPSLHLGLVQPIDDVAVDRILCRCRRVIVLEPEPGLVEAEILRCAERLKGDGAERATVHGRFLPAREDGTLPKLEPIEYLHPSMLVRRIEPLIDMVHPDRTQRTLLSPPLPIPDSLSDASPMFGAPAHDQAVERLAQKIFSSITEEGEWLLDTSASEDEDSPSAPEPMRLHYNGDIIGAGDGREIHLETWSHHRFVRFGLSVIRDAALESTPRLLLISQHAGGRDLDRFARSAIPAGAAEHVAVRHANLSEQDRLMATAHELLHAPGLSILFLDDGPPVQYDTASIESTQGEIDRIGFQVMQRLIWPADRACVIRQPLQQAEREVMAARQTMPAETIWSTQTLSHRWPPRFGGRIRPLIEQVEVHRSKAPHRHRADPARTGLPVPTALHAEHSTWRVHVAGMRGETPGVALKLLQAAGAAMDYEVRWIVDSEPIGAGRRAWGQMAFTRHDPDGTEQTVDGRIPFGEANLLLGFDRAATLRAIGPDGGLRIASDAHTSAVVNTGLFEDQLDLERAGENVQTMTSYIESMLMEDASMFGDFSDACRYRFHNERLADVVQVGVAFQLGFIPVTVDSMISATRTIESQGHARTIEAFEYGRRIALDATALRRPQEDVLEEGIDRIARRFGHVFRRSGPGRLARAAHFRKLLQRALLAMPELEDTELGRHARRDLVVALRRCLIWGGFDEANRLVDLLISLYRSDPGGHDRLLTSLAILPLSESMLIRDAVYMASMSISPEHRRRTRLRLNVKRGRGDRIESRYVTRFELVIYRWRFRLDLRTSDWATRLLASARHVIPTRFRGTRREREARTAVRDLVQRATLDAQHYEQWVGIFKTLHEMALDGRLRRATQTQLLELIHD